MAAASAHLTGPLTAGLAERPTFGVPGGHAQGAAATGAGFCGGKALAPKAPQRPIGQPGGDRMVLAALSAGANVATVEARATDPATFDDVTQFAGLVTNDAARRGRSVDVPLTKGGYKPDGLGWHRRPAGAEPLGVLVEEGAESLEGSWSEPQSLDGVLQALVGDTEVAGVNLGAGGDQCPTHVPSGRRMTVRVEGSVRTFLPAVASLRT
jgi:hypothetical protein